MLHLVGSSVLLYLHWWCTVKQKASRNFTFYFNILSSAKLSCITDSVLTVQWTYSFSIINIKPFSTLQRNNNSSGIHEQLLNSICGQNAVLSIKPGGKYSSHLMFFSDRASWIDYILITNLMHWLLFIHKILFSSTYFEHQELIFRRIQLYTCSIWYCHSLWEFMVACRYTAWVRTDCRGKVVGRAS